MAEKGLPDDLIEGSAWIKTQDPKQRSDYTPGASPALGLPLVLLIGLALTEDTGWLTSNTIHQITKFVFTARQSKLQRRGTVQKVHF